MNNNFINRDYSIDILRFIAAIIITYSHMEPQLGEYSIFATGGSFGNCLFFFCSGYTLSMSNKKKSFLNWYKNRIYRVYPTVFSWAIISGIMFSADYTFNDVLINGGGYFIKCIMIFYIVFYPFIRLSYHRVLTLLLMYYLFAYSVFFIIDYKDETLLYNWKWSLYFIIMLLGSAFSKLSKDYKKKYVYGISLFYSLLLLVSSSICYYLIMYVSNLEGKLYFVMPLIIVPQVFVTYAFYVLSNKVVFLMKKSKVFYFVTMFIGGLCLEVYIVQPMLINKFPMLSIFPANIFIVIFLIILCAYFLKVLSSFWTQTFSKEDYNFRGILKFY